MNDVLPGVAEAKLGQEEEVAFETGVEKHIQEEDHRHALQLLLHYNNIIRLDWSRNPSTVCLG